MNILWSRKNHKEDGEFLRKDDQGNDLFYPWGYPGEAFHITRLQRKLIFTFGWLVFSISFVTIILEIFSNWNGISYILFDFLPLFYIFVVYFFSKKAKPLAKHDDKNLSIFRSLLDGFCFSITWLILAGADAIMMILFIYGLIYSLIASPERLPFLYPEGEIFMSVLVYLYAIAKVVFLNYFFWKLFITRGYFFAKPPSCQNLA